MDVVNLADKLSQFTEAWSPRIVGEINDMHVKVVKLHGEFVWHHHDNTGNVANERTVAELERI